MQPFEKMTTAPTNPYIAALITEPQNPFPVKWNPTGPLKVFFDDTGTRAWTDAEKAAALKAFGEWQTVANISYELTTDRSQADVLSVFNLSSTILGVTSAPADGPNPITITFSVLDKNFANIQVGGDTYQTLVHEIGHTLGLYHPHDGTLFPGVPDKQDQNTGDNQQNQAVFTAMSYVRGWTGEGGSPVEFGGAIGPMAFDIAAVQYMYGAKAAQTGDNVYLLPTTNGNGTGYDCIWDTAGIDTISGAAATTGLTIDLRPAPLIGPNAGGFVSWIAGIKGGFTIANGVTVENATGGSGNDTLIGNAANNLLTGGKGNDSITGGDGIDTVRIDANKADAVFTKAAGSVTVRTTGDGTDTLVSVERVQLNDGIEALDVGAGQNGGEAFRLYKAAFARTPDTQGVSFWIKQLDAGKSLLDVAKDFTFQKEFIDTYGASPTASDYVSKLYLNILGRAGEAAGVAFWTKELTSGARDMAKVLADFTESPENVAGVAASIEDGFWYF